MSARISRGVTTAPAIKALMPPIRLLNGSKVGAGGGKRGAWGFLHIKDRHWWNASPAGTTKFKNLGEEKIKNLIVEATKKGTPYPQVSTDRANVIHSNIKFIWNSNQVIGTKINKATGNVIELKKIEVIVKNSGEIITAYPIK